MTFAISSVAANAAVLINRTDVGTAINVGYGGTVLGIPTSGLNAIGSFVYTGASADGRTYNFTYDLSNTSSVTSRVRSFGFDVLGNTAISAASSTGTYATASQNPLSGLIGTDLCFSAGGLGTCTAGSGGMTAGQSATGSFALTFASAMAAISLDDFTVNYQGVGGLFAGTGRGDATATLPAPTIPTTPTTPTTPLEPVSYAPESSTWAMMMIGFGLIGGLLRRRGSAARPALQG